MKIGTTPILPVADYITIFLYDGKGKKIIRSGVCLVLYVKYISL